MGPPWLAALAWAHLIFERSIWAWLRQKTIRRRHLPWRFRRGEFRDDRGRWRDALLLPRAKSPWKRGNHKTGQRVQRRGETPLMTCSLLIIRREEIGCVRIKLTE